MLAVLLPVGAELYAVPMDCVREVVAAPDVAMLATAPAFVAGLFNLRGQIVPLFDTAAVLGVGAVGGVTFAAVIETSLGLAGLAATELPQRALLTNRTGPSELPGTSGVYEHDRRVVVMLEPEALLTQERLDRDFHGIAILSGAS